MKICASIEGVTGKSCENSAFEMAIRAQNHAYDAERSLKTMKDRVDEAFKETAEVRENTKNAHENAFKVNTMVSFFLNIKFQK